MRDALWSFIEIIGISVPSPHKISSVYQLCELVAVCRLRHSDCLTYRGGREGQCEAVCVGREIEIQHERVCTQITRRRLPVFVFNTEKVRLCSFSVNGHKPLIWYSIWHFLLLLFYWNGKGGKTPPADSLLSSEIFKLLIQAVNLVKNL